LGTLVPITEPSDPRLGDYSALTDAALRKRYERERGVLIAEGPNPVHELIASPYPVRSLLLTDERVATSRHLVDAVDVPVYVVERDLLYEVVRFRLHQGVLGCGGRLPPTPLESLLHVARRLVVLEGLNDHENLGTLFRSARALGMDAVVLGPGCADPLYRRSVRVSMGHVLHVPHGRVGDLSAGLDRVAEAGFTIVGLTPDPVAPPIDELDLADVDRVAVLLGAEGPGLSETALRGARVTARIPMHGGVDSLNVAAAGAIAFHRVGPGVRRG
jgi:tRNA G18 (ribose-2'-O)-methylase SpoU